MTETTEIARAQPAHATDAAVEAGPEVELAALQEPLPEIAALQEQLPEIDTPGDVYWDQPRATTGPEDEPEPAPTWVEPERWPPTGPAETSAPASLPPPQSPDETAPVHQAAPDPPEEHAEQIAPTQDLEPEPGATRVETHPSPPPAQLIPSWMEIPPASDAELEEVGRAAVDDAIGPPAEPALDTAAPVEVPSMADYVGPTSAAEAALPASDEWEPPREQDATDQVKAPRRSWFAAILGRRPSQPSQSAAAPEESGAAPGNAELTVAEPTVRGPEATERPEAERLMWITPRAPAVEPAAEPEPLPEPAAEPEPPGAAEPIAEAPPEPAEAIQPLLEVEPEPAAAIETPLEPASVAAAIAGTAAEAVRGANRKRGRRA